MNKIAYLHKFLGVASTEIAQSLLTDKAKEEDELILFLFLQALSCHYHYYISFWPRDFE